MTAPVAFISYSHDSQDHKRWVLDLATRLRSNGVDVILDQWDLGPGGDLPHFMEQAVAKSARVLMICTERYTQKANLGSGGVGYEKMIVTAELLQRIESNRFIPIVRQSGARDLPRFLGSKLYIDLSSADLFETGFDQLLRELLGVPLFQKPPLGEAPTLNPQEPPKPSFPDPVTQFMQALASIYEASSNRGGIATVKVRQAMGVSKLLFEHAFDLAIKRELVHSGGTMEHIWVQPAGRRLMIEIAS
jgi:hypothetical protein